MMQLKAALKTPKNMRNQYTESDNGMLKLIGSKILIYFFTF